MSDASLKNHRSLSAICIVALLGIAGGCAAPLRDGSNFPRAGRALCLRGFIDIFSLGLDDLAARLRKSGVNSRSVGDWTWRVLPSQIIKAHQNGTLDRPLVLVGHSYGADNSIRIAHTLERHDIDIDLLVLLDATTPPRIPPNVHRCVHFYRRTIMGDLFPMLSAGSPVLPERGNMRTQIENIVITRETFGDVADRIDHWNIDRSQAIHERVAAEVLKACPLRVARAPKGGGAPGAHLGRMATGGQ